MRTMFNVLEVFRSMRGVTGAILVKTITLLCCSNIQLDVLLRNVTESCQTALDHLFKAA